MFVYPTEDVTFTSTCIALTETNYKVRDAFAQIVAVWEAKFDPVIGGNSFGDSPFREVATDYYDGTVFRLRPWVDNDDQFWNFIWRDVAISWYKRCTRGAAATRDMSDEEIEEMMSEVLAEIRAIKIEDVISGKYPGLAQLANRLEKKLVPTMKMMTLTEAHRHKKKIERNSTYGATGDGRRDQEAKDAQRQERTWADMKEELARHSTGGFPPNLFSGIKK